MSRYDYCLRHVLGAEGGLSDHPLDGGGRTNFGVTQDTYDDYRMSHGRPVRPVDEIEREEVRQIYWTYWRDGKCSQLPEPLDLYVFDMAVNSGARRAIKTLQQCLGVTPDGIYGPQTDRALKEEVASGTIGHIADAYLNLREDYYEIIVERNPSQHVFLHGWLNRVDRLRLELA